MVTLSARSKVTSVRRCVASVNRCLSSACSSSAAAQNASGSCPDHAPPARSAHACAVQKSTSWQGSHQSA
jgi:hypothetical protein